MFLVGQGIPEHIRTLPQTFLNTPFGQMIKPHITTALNGFRQGGSDVDATRPRRYSNNINGIGSSNLPNGISGGTNGNVSKASTDLYAPKTPTPGIVHNVTRLQEVKNLLAAASKSCAVIFFTSSTCAPCKIVYAAYDELAAEAGNKAVLIKVDLNLAYDVNSKYCVRATPTFMTFLKGEKQDEWSGANESQLRGNVRILIQMAWPSHPHTNLRLPSLQRNISQPVTYKKIPPLDKLVTKIGDAGKDPSVTAVVNFVKTRDAAGPAEAAVPDLKALSTFIQSTFNTLPMEVHFAVIDLVRVAFVDFRVSGYFAEETDHQTLRTLLSRTKDLSACSYSLRLVMLQLACNLFTSQLYAERIVSNDTLREAGMRLVTTCLLDSHPNIRVVAASLVYNIAAYNHNERFEDRPDRISENDQVELLASLLEAIRMEKESVEAFHGMLFALGLLVYGAPVDGEVLDVCKALGAAEMIREKGKVKALAKEPLLKEVGEELLGKGLS